MSCIDDRVPRSLLIGVVKLSPRESQIFEILRSGDPMTIDELVERTGGSNETRVSAKGITVMIKSLSFKIVQFGYKITMIHGGRGRGRKATYKMERIK